MPKPRRPRRTNINLRRNPFKSWLPYGWKQPETTGGWLADGGDTWHPNRIMSDGVVLRRHLHDTPQSELQSHQWATLKGFAYYRGWVKVSYFQTKNRGRKFHYDRDVRRRLTFTFNSDHAFQLDASLSISAIVKEYDLHFDGDLKYAVELVEFVFPSVEDGESAKAHHKIVSRKEFPALGFFELFLQRSA